jgi:hypothetical protein
VLSFAAIKHSDPVHWEHWRSVLEQYDKAALIEHLVREPERIEDSEWKSTADRLISLARDTGLEPFHDPDQQAWASVHVAGHWENHPIRSRDFQLFLLRTYYNDTGKSPGNRQYEPRRSCSRLVLFLMERSARSTCEWLSIVAAFILTYAIAPGGR